MDLRKRNRKLVGSRSRIIGKRLDVWAVRHVAMRNFWPSYELMKEVERIEWLADHAHVLNARELRHVAHLMLGTRGRLGYLRRRFGMGVVGRA